jgi:hypothetical protein
MSCDEIVIPPPLRFLDAVSSSPVYQKTEAARSCAT